MLAALGYNEKRTLTSLRIEKFTSMTSVHSWWIIEALHYSQSAKVCLEWDEKKSLATFENRFLMLHQFFLLLAVKYSSHCPKPLEPELSKGYTYIMYSKDFSPFSCMGTRRYPIKWLTSKSENDSFFYVIKASFIVWITFLIHIIYEMSTTTLYKICV